MRKKYFPFLSQIERGAARFSSLFRNVGGRSRPRPRPSPRVVKLTHRRNGQIHRATNNGTHLGREREGEGLGTCRVSRCPIQPSDLTEKNLRHPRARYKNSQGRPGNTARSWIGWKRPSTCCCCCGMGEEGGARCNPLHSECMGGERGDERKGRGGERSRAGWVVHSPVQCASSLKQRNS